MLDRIKRDPTTVVCPVIDVIDDNTFEYHYSKAYFTNVGGFDWSLQFNWHAIPERDRKSRKRHIDPVRLFFTANCFPDNCSTRSVLEISLFIMMLLSLVSFKLKYFSPLLFLLNSPVWIPVTFFL